MYHQKTFLSPNRALIGEKTWLILATLVLRLDCVQVLTKVAASNICVNMHMPFPKTEHRLGVGVLLYAYIFKKELACTQIANGVTVIPPRLDTARRAILRA